MPRSLRALLLVTLSLAAGACELAPAAGAPAVQASATGGIRLIASGGQLVLAGIARVNVAVGPGAGPVFEPILAQLSPGATSTWASFIYGVPEGPGREVTLTAFDAGGNLSFQGGSRVDIANGSTASVVIILLATAPAATDAASAASIDYLTVSSATVAPGGTATLTASVTNGSGAEVLTYRWAGTCGSFSDATTRSAVWTAPSTPDVQCQLSFTAASAHASSTVGISVAVRQDGAARNVSGRRMSSCWPDQLAGAAGAVAPSMVSPDVGALAAPAALVETSPGVWSTFPGGHLTPSGAFVQGGFDAGGSFFIPQVPGGSRYLLSFNDPSGVRWLVDTNSSSIDLGYDQLGRCDLEPSAPGTVLSLGLSGMFPWSPGTSQLQLTSSAASLWSPVPTMGALGNGVTYGNPELLLSGFALPAAADVLWVHELSRALHPDGLRYLSAVRAGALTGAALVQGANNEFSLPVSYAHQTGALPVDWSAPDFEAQLPLLAPAARVTAGIVPPHRLTVSASPYTLSGPAPAPPGGTPDLALVDLPAGAARLTLSSPLRYGQFLPPSWLEWREVRFATAVGYQAPGATDTLYDVAAVGNREALPLSAGTSRPLVTAVGALRLNGQDALLDQTQPVTTSPTFAWAAPAQGSPSHYKVEIFELAVPAGYSVSTLVVRYLTTATSVTLPPGILVSGGVYYAKVTAQASAAPFDTAPLRYAPVFAYATTLTGTFSP